MAKFNTSLCRKFGEIEEENQKDASTEKDTVFYENSKHVSIIFEDTDSEISDEEDYYQKN
jgi:hypothetical protein